MRIFILGFMGSGKSTIGKKLAYRLNLPFYDLDRLIEQKYNANLNEIFNTLGEDKFRLIEKNLLEEYLLKDNYVLSTGGGTPCFFNNMELINKSGISVYLDTSIPIIVNRLINAKRKRPMIGGMNKEQLEIFIKNKLTERTKFYKQAKITIPADNFKIQILIELLKNI